MREDWYLLFKVIHDSCQIEEEDKTNNHKTDVVVVLDCGL